MDREHIRGFLLNNAVIQIELDRLNEARGFNREVAAKRLEADPYLSGYMPQFAPDLRTKAAAMSAYYEIFYLLENHIRMMIVDVLRDAAGPDWWDASAPQSVKDSAKHNRQRELDHGISQRSIDEIDYITFGELGEIIRFNWDNFGGIFQSRKGVEKVMSSLNLLRGTIAHCGMLSDDEVLRLKLTVRDWFRLMSWSLERD
ncbi:MAG: Swt1 family HEPN domain-containing protein [Salinarimonas sp.]